MDDQSAATETPGGEQSSPATETTDRPRGKRPRQKSKDELLREGWTKLSASDLKALVSQLWNELGGKLTPISSELNRRKILTLGSAMWSYQNLRAYVEKNPDVKKKRRRAEKEPSAKVEPKKSKTAPPRESGRETIQLDSREPMWKKELAAGKDTIYVKKELLERAKEKAERERLKTGGNLSRLCAVLLWHYLGCPEDLIETE